MSRSPAGADVLRWEEQGPDTGVHATETSRQAFSAIALVFYSTYCGGKKRGRRETSRRRWRVVWNNGKRNVQRVLKSKTEVWFCNIEIVMSWKNAESRICINLIYLNGIQDLYVSFISLCFHWIVRPSTLFLKETLFNLSLWCVIDRMTQPLQQQLHRNNISSFCIKGKEFRGRLSHIWHNCKEMKPPNLLMKHDSVSTL